MRGAGRRCPVKCPKGHSRAASVAASRRECGRAAGRGAVALPALGRLGDAGALCAGGPARDSRPPRLPGWLAHPARIRARDGRLRAGANLAARHCRSSARPGCAARRPGRPALHPARPQIHAASVIAQSSCQCCPQAANFLAKTAHLRPKIDLCDPCASHTIIYPRQAAAPYCTRRQIMGGGGAACPLTASVGGPVAAHAECRRPSCRSRCWRRRPSRWQ